MNIRWREKTNKMQLIWCLLSNFLYQHESNSNFHKVHTSHNAAPQDNSQPQPTHPGRTPHAVGHGLILLMMGIMMPETCWDRKFDDKHRVSCILLVLSLHHLLILALSNTDFWWLQSTCVQHFWVFCLLKAFQNEDRFQQIPSHLWNIVTTILSGFHSFNHPWNLS